MACLAGRSFCRIRIPPSATPGRLHSRLLLPTAKLSIELDGFQPGLPEQHRHDQNRENFPASAGVEELRFWNHQGRMNKEVVLLEIWNALDRGTGCVAVIRKVQNHRFLPPKVNDLIQPPPKPG